MENEQLETFFLNETATFTLKIEEAVQAVITQEVQRELEKLEERTWRGALEAELDALASKNADLQKGQLELAEEKDKIATEKEFLENERRKIQMEKEELAELKSRIASEQEELAKEKDMLVLDLEFLARERTAVANRVREAVDKVAEEMAGLDKVKKKIVSEKEELASSKKLLALEKEDLAKERLETVKIRGAVDELRVKSENLLENLHSMVSRLEEKQQQLKRKDAQLKEMNNALIAQNALIGQETRSPDMVQELAEESEQFEQRLAREWIISHIEKLNLMEEMSDGWMKIDDFFRDLARLRSVFNVSFETASAVKRLLDHLNYHKKIVASVIKLDKRSDLTFVTIGAIVEDRSVLPVAREGTPGGLDSTLRVLYNTLLNKARQSSPQSTSGVF